MKPFLRLGALLILSVGAISSSPAAYNPAIVAADARWVVFADFNALRNSVVGKELLAFADIQTKTAAGPIGVNLQKVLMTVGTVTAYGTNFSPDPEKIDGTLVAQGTPELRKIAESLLLQGVIAQPDVFAESREFPFAAYTVSDPKAKGGPATQLIVAFPPEPVVLIGKSAAQLVKARDVFRGAAPSQAKAVDSMLTKMTGGATGAFLFAASVVPTEPIFPQNAPQARILQLTNSAAVALGEREPNTFARVELYASSDQNAERLGKILQGLTAMLALAESNDRQLSDFLNSTSVTQENDRVTLQLAYSSARLVQMTQNLRERNEERPKRVQTVQMVSGKTLAEWDAGTDEGSEAPGEGGLRWRTIDNVKLANGSTITLGRAMNGGRMARFDRVEIVPADGSGAPLVFKSEFMRAVGGRGVMAQFLFPGSEGTYTLKVAYHDDPDGKAKFAVSVREPRAPAASRDTETPPAVPASPAPPAKSK